MKMREILVEMDDSRNLATALEFLRNRSHNKQIKAVATPASIVNMVHNLGGNEAFGETDLRELIANDPTIQNLVKGFDEETNQITLRPFGDEVDLEPEEQPENPDAESKNPEKTVSAMAKRAANNRS